MDLWKKLFLLFTACIFLMIAWGIFNLFQVPKTTVQTTTFNDISQSFSISFFAPDSHESITNLEFKVQSNINGRASLILSNPDSSFSELYVLNSDSSTAKYSGDWYSNSFKLKYIPQDSTTGTLSVTYSF
ncbi:MAG: hypothetical protein ROO71_10195 [Balneola sp.]